MESKDNVEKVSMFEVKKCLKDAGSFDSTMSDNEMMELYEVLNHSKSTASKEDERRRILEQTEMNCSMLEELRRNSEPVNSGRSNQTAVQNDSDFSTTDDEMFEQKPLKRLQQTKPQEKEPTAVPTKTSPNQNIEPVENEQIIDVFNSIPTTHRPLKRISFKTSYDPPFYCHPKLAKMNNERKAQAIAEYHLKLIHEYENYQRQSIHPAPWGRPIQNALRFNGSLTKKIEKLPEEDVDMQDTVDPLNDDKDFEEEIYISQSGRQTKRKLYAENVENINEAKRNKTSTNDTNQSSKKLQTTRKRNGTLKNDEIIKRSRLFGDNNATRTEKMFDKMIEDEPKKKSMQKEVEKFQESLNPISDDENIDVESSLDVAEIIHSEEPFIRRRVVPPLHTKKQSASSTASKPAGQGRGSRRATNKKGSQENSQELKTQKYESLETSTKSSSKEEMGTCPMCNLKFPQSELEQHASGCEDSYCERATKTNISDQSIKKMSCECCDQVFPLSMDYEVHVRDCLLRSKRTQSKAV